VGGPRPPRKKAGEPKHMRPPQFPHYEPTQHLVFLDNLFVLFQVKRGTICQFTVVHFDFCLISNVFSCRYASITLEWNFWHQFRLLKFDVKPEKFDCEKTELSGITDRNHNATVNSRPATSFGHQGQGGWRIFWGRPKFYIDSMYENSGYAYNMSKTFFQGGRKFFQGAKPSS